MRRGTLTKKQTHVRAFKSDKSKVNAWRKRKKLTEAQAMHIIIMRGTR